MWKALSEARSKKGLRTISVAAAAVIVCAAIIYTVLPESVVPVDADKNTKQKVEEKDGVVIINEGDVEGDSGEVSITETDWDKIEDLKEYVPNLYIPGYVPEGYEFEKATVVRYSEEAYNCEYLFRNNDKSVSITKISVSYTHLDVYKRQLYGTAGTGTVPGESGKGGVR